MFPKGIGIVVLTSDCKRFQSWIPLKVNEFLKKSAWVGRVYPPPSAITVELYPLAQALHGVLLQDASMHHAQSCHHSSLLKSSSLASVSSLHYASGVVVTKSISYHSSALSLNSASTLLSTPAMQPSSSPCGVVPGRCITAFFCCWW